MSGLNSSGYSGAIKASHTCLCSLMIFCLSFSLQGRKAPGRSGSRSSNISKVTAEYQRA